MEAIIQNPAPPSSALPLRHIHGLKSSISTATMDSTAIMSKRHPALSEERVALLHQKHREKSIQRRSEFIAGRDLVTITLSDDPGDELQRPGTRRVVLGRAAYSFDEEVFIKRISNGAYGSCCKLMSAAAVPDDGRMVPILDVFKLIICDAHCSRRARACRTHTRQRCERRSSGHRQRAPGRLSATKTKDGAEERQTHHPPPRASITRRAGADGGGPRWRYQGNLETDCSPASRLDPEDCRYATTLGLRLLRKQSGRAGIWPRLGRRVERNQTVYRPDASGCQWRTRP